MDSKKEEDRSYTIEQTGPHRAVLQPKPGVLPGEAVLSWLEEIANASPKESEKDS